jgi:hypothetical protein
MSRATPTIKSRTNHEARRTKLSHRSVASTSEKSMGAIQTYDWNFRPVIAMLSPAGPTFF